ncbi:unnamed protein product [Auanema sp. JU1783]|nr:unnamed protein product [Auanema sp. JU1783]
MSDTLLGLSYSILTCIFFGSVFVPVKNAPAGDGFIAQVFICLGGFLVSLVYHVLCGIPSFYPQPLLGGALWCIGNACAIPLMNKLGMGLAILIWSTFSCLWGWATQRFGLFGLEAVAPKSVTMNYIGIICLIIGGLSFSFIKPVTTRKENKETELEKEAYYPQKEEEVSDQALRNNKEIDEAHHLPIVTKLLLCSSAAIVGCFYGNLVTPITYMLSHPEVYPDIPRSYTAYLLPIWSGILATSLTICIAYSIIKYKTSVFNTKCILPCFASGIIMGLGFVFFMLCNELLSQSIASPVCVMAPGFVIALWSTLYFKEIKGRTNLIILGSAYVFTLLGVILVSVSKDVDFF